MGHRVDDQDFVAALCSALPTTYHNLKTFTIIEMIHSRHLDSLTFIDHILEEECMR
jgi:hypothetical protein